MHSGNYFTDFYFRSSGRSNLQFFYLAHILYVAARVSMSVTMFLIAFGVQEMAVRLDTGSETVPGQNFTSINFRGLGFIRKYSVNLYTAKISTHMVVSF